MGEREDMFRDLCENAHDLIQSVAPNGRFFYVNRAWLETLGYSRDEVAGLTAFDVIHPDSRDHCAQLMRRLLSGEEIDHIEADFQDKHGRRIPVVGSASCRFERGRPVATRGIFRDVTRRRRAEGDLNRLFHLSLDLLCVAGTDGYFKKLNPAFERTLGYSRDQLLSRSFVEFVHPDDREGTQAAVERLARGLPVVDFDNRYKGKDGSYRWLSWRAAPMPDSGLIYAVARDITEQKRIEETMARQAEELARSNADLEQFAYVASHDLRAPLRSVANLAQWIEEDMPDRLPQSVARHLREMRRRVNRMETLTGELLAYARAGRVSREIRRVHTAELIDDLVFLLSPPKGFVIRVDSSMPEIETDRPALEQVFRNLIGNAIKHHDLERGVISISARELPQAWEFSVTDDGPGIPPEAHDRVFSMFHKLHPRDEVDGNGIGLALVQRIVERHGGQVRLESGRGRGATFRFTWPKTIDAEPPPG